MGEKREEKEGGGRREKGREMGEKKEGGERKREEKERGRRKKERGRKYNKHNAQVYATKEEYGDQLLFHHEALQRTTCALYVKHTQSR